MSGKFLQMAACLVLTFCAPAHLSAQTWERLGPEGGDVISLAASPDGTVYLGTADGHIFASFFLSGSSTAWQIRGRAGARLDGVVQQLLVDSTNPHRLFAALWFQDPGAGGGIFRSEDGARTWVFAGLRGEAVRALAQSTSHPDLLLAGTRTGIFRSQDRGANWERISRVGDDELKNIDSLAIDPSDPRVIYAGTYHLPWKTTDGGKTWAPISTGMIDDSDVMSLRIDAANPARLFASACSGIYRSENGGASWTKLQGIPYSSRRTQAIVQDPLDARVLYAGTTEGLWVTRDAGETWSRTTPRAWVVNAVALAKEGTGPPALLLGMENQGVLMSRDSGLNFFPAPSSNTGFSHRVTAALAGDLRDPAHLLLRLAGSGETVLESHDAAKTWEPLSTQTLPASIEKLFATESGWWASLTGGGLAHYEDALKKWQRFRFPQPVPVATASKQTATAHRKPAPPPVPLPDPQIFDVQASPTRVYAATANGLWCGEIGKPMLKRFPSSSMRNREPLLGLQLIPDSEELWAVSATKVLHSSDAGKTWTMQSPHLSGPGSNTLLWVRVVATGQGDTLLLGTQYGVYQAALPALVDWRLLQRGLPAAASGAPLITKNFFLLPMRSGGIYLSPDWGKTWLRLDSPKEESVFTGFADDTQGGFFAASQTGGVLHWNPAANAAP